MILPLPEKKYLSFITTLKAVQHTRAPANMAHRTYIKDSYVRMVFIILLFFFEKQEEC